MSETIRGRRLERARRDLADPALVDESIFDIASRWGFVSKSHFSRAFRAAYRQSPSDFRREMLASALDKRLTKCAHCATCLRRRRA